MASDHNIAIWLDELEEHVKKEDSMQCEATTKNLLRTFREGSKTGPRPDDRSGEIYEDPDRMTWLRMLVHIDDVRKRAARGKFAKALEALHLARQAFEERLVEALQQVVEEYSACLAKVANARLSMPQATNLRVHQEAALAKLRCEKARLHLEEFRQCGRSPRTKK